jgi:hypothetical protein
MAAIEEPIPGRPTVAQRWLARGAIVAAAASALVPLLAIGFQASLAAIIIGVVGMGVTAASVWWALTHKGIVRWLAVVLAVLAALVVLIPVHGQGPALGRARGVRVAGPGGRARPGGAAP